MIFNIPFCSEYLCAQQEVEQLRQQQSRLRNERDVSLNNLGGNLQFLDGIEYSSTKTKLKS